MVYSCLRDMSFEHVSFKRPHHIAILTVLRALDGDFLVDAECYFAGGTALVLDLGEYRESVDIDFLCADREGYRALRTALAGRADLTPILRPGSQLTCIRDVRADQYGLRTVVQSQNAPIKLEIVRETRINLRGACDPRYGLPVLSRVHMYAEKLLANSDRWYAPETASRDILDLSMMMSRWGPIPDEAWQIAYDAYGERAREDFEKAVAKIRNPNYLDTCAQKMQIDPKTVDEILAVLNTIKRDG